MSSQSSSSQSPTNSSGGGGGGATAARMRQQQRRRRRGMSAPPLRLAWPGRIVGSGGGSAGNNNDDTTTTATASQPVAGASAVAASRGSENRKAKTTTKKRSSSLDNINNKSNNNNRTKKRSRRVTIQDNNTNNRNSGGSGGQSQKLQSQQHSSSSSSLWIDSYAPTSSKDLSLAPKKMKEIVTFLNQGKKLLMRSQSQQGGGVNNNNNNNSNDPCPAKLLILVGSPGIGKSTAFRILAKEQGYSTVHEWNESIYSFEQNASWSPGNNSMSFVEQQSPISSFENFLRQAGAGYSSLSMKNDKNDESSSSNSNNNSVIVLEELPNYRYSQESVQRFRTILTNHVRTTNVPTCLIFSDVTEGQHRPNQLEDMIDRNVLYSEWVQILQVHPPTKARFKRIMNNIILLQQQQQEGCSSGARKKNNPELLFDVEDSYAKCGGDLRFAITTLQVEQCGKSQKQSQQGPASAKKRKSDSGSTSSSCKKVRDERLTTFHALGKLLYAKRIEERQQPPPSASTAMSATAEQSEGDDDSHCRPPLQFVPERVIEQSDMELNGTLSFLEYHSADFFTDITELSQALESFSDATFLLDRPRELSGASGGGSRSFRGGGGDYSQQTQTSSAFPEGYAASLAGRTVACFNRHPVPGKFRHLNAPKVFEVMRKRSANHNTLRHIYNNLSLSSSSSNHASGATGADGGGGYSSGSGNVSMSCYLGGTSLFATDCLPFVRTILPGRGEPCHTLDQLHSHIRSTMMLDNKNKSNEEEEEETAMILQEQAELLQEDDIVEDSSSSDDDNANDDDGDFKSPPTESTTTTTTNAVTDNNSDKEPAITASSESPISTVASPTI